MCLKNILQDVIKRKILNLIEVEFYLVDKLEWF